MIETEKIVLEDYKTPQGALTIEEIREAGMKNPVRVIHSLCGAIVFWHEGLPKGMFGIIDPAKVLLLNGARARDGDPIVCRFCGYKVQSHQLEWIIKDG